MAKTLNKNQETTLTRAGDKIFKKAAMDEVSKVDAAMAQTIINTETDKQAILDTAKEYQPKKCLHPSDLMNNEDCAKFYSTISCLRTEAMALQAQADILWSRRRALIEDPRLINVFGETSNKETY